MKPSQFYEFTIPAYGAYMLTVGGDYFKILRATGPISIKAKWGELRGLISGQGLEASPFDRLELRDESGAANTVRLFIGDEKFIDGLAGAVDIARARVPQVDFTQAQVTVTNASAQILPANASRQYLLIQNKDSGGDVFIKFGAGPATVAGGVRLVAGGVFETGAAVPMQAVHAIGSIANNPNVIVMEGA